MCFSGEDRLSLVRDGPATWRTEESFNQAAIPHTQQHALPLLLIGDSCGDKNFLCKTLRYWVVLLPR